MPDRPTLPTLLGRTDRRLGPVEWTCGRLLRALGWDVRGSRPSPGRFVIIVAPHTSNWDFVVCLLAAWGLGLLKDFPHGFLMKDSLDRGPLRPIMRRLGGIPVVRTHPERAVERAAAEFGKRDRYFLALAPEGTRKPTRHWRSGFWHIARRAGVPVIPVALDYGRKELRLGDPVELTGDAEADLARLRPHFAGAKGLHPEAASPVELAPEKVGDARRDS